MSPPKTVIQNYFCPCRLHSIHHFLWNHNPNYGTKNI